MEPLTLFTWGYWGWGTAVPQLLAAVDAVEAARGYQPPFFVDIRISRSGRAPGFRGDAFAKLVGASRYRWMDDLGNEAIGKGGELRIKKPEAAKVLLELAMKSAKQRQRLLFFCACEFLGTEENLGCHRVRVASHLLEAARKRRVPVQVVEWPGGEPQLGSFGLQISEEAFDKVRRGSASVPLENPAPLAKMAGLPWYSLVAVRPNRDQSVAPILLLSGPAHYKKEGWYLPIYENIDPELSLNNIRQRIQELRRASGFVSRQA